MKSFSVYYQYYFCGLLIWVFKVNDDLFIHYFVDFDIHFESDLPF
jgi:hypothetical protein